MKTIRVIDFTRYPGPRFKKLGEGSGEEFRDLYLVPLFKEPSADEDILIDLDGTEGYPTSFLEEAFGGLARIFGAARVLKRLKFQSANPRTEVEIRHYVQRVQDAQK